MEIAALPNNGSCKKCGCRFDWSWRKCPSCGWTINNPDIKQTTIKT